jgi:anti-sigma factor RsiW
MNHNHHPEEYRLLAFLDEELEAGEASLVRDHLEVCDQCRQTLADFSAVQEMVQCNIPQQTPQPVWSAIATKRSFKNEKNLTPSLVFGTLAACAAGIALGFLLGAPQGGNTAVQGTEAWASADYLWSEADSPSLFTTFSSENSQERSGES